jgi:hypothetical protein
MMTVTNGMPNPCAKSHQQTTRPANYNDPLGQGKKSDAHVAFCREIAQTGPTDGFDDLIHQATDGTRLTSLTSATIGQKNLGALGALGALGFMGARWLPMSISGISIFIGRHRIPLAPVLPDLPCLVPDGGHPIVPDSPLD